MNLLHYTENTLDTKQMEDIFAHYKRTIHACREDLHGIQQKWDFGDGFSVVFTILGASYFNFTLAMSLNDDRLVTNP